ncbi:hypothetical protein DFS34DRAFT_397875 [Phlyctochytrium arcticum]|nr:hypothetical protein DFS34DRAFT_397875 [Phlyctochytrium arcticum]
MNGLNAFCSACCYESLISVQQGGYYRLYEPCQDEEMLFVSLETNVIDTFNARVISTSPPATFPDTAYTELIEQHFHNVFSFVRDNRSTTLGQSRPYETILNGGARQGTIEQAIPLAKAYAQLDNLTLVFVVGTGLFRASKILSPVPSGFLTS